MFSFFYGFLQAIPESSSSSVKMKTAEIRETLIEKYKCSEFSINTRRRIQEISVTGFINFGVSKFVFRFLFLFIYFEE